MCGETSSQRLQQEAQSVLCSPSLKTAEKKRLHKFGQCQCQQLTTGLTGFTTRALRPDNMVRLRENIIM